MKEASWWYLTRYRIGQRWKAIPLGVRVPIVAVEAFVIAFGSPLLLWTIEGLWDEDESIKRLDVLTALIVALVAAVVAPILYWSIHAPPKRRRRQ